MKKSMFTVEEVSQLIESGKILSIAGDEKLLNKLPKGNWIGGTIPYFISENGGEFNDELLYVTSFENEETDFEILKYDKKNISSIYLDAFENGYSIIIIPASSEIHFQFSLKSSTYKNFAIAPLIGWVSGVSLDNLNKVTPKVFNGLTSNYSENEAIVMHLELPKTKYAQIDIVNIFTQDLNGDKIEFINDSFSASEVLVNGEEVNFCDYLKESKLDTKLPLVADFNGTMINTSFKYIDEENKTVHFYAPVFNGVEYKHACSIENYVEEFLQELPIDLKTPVFSCNCLLNYLYSELEGKKTANFTGPITFGEIAYQLLSQTMVFLEVKDS